MGSRMEVRARSGKCLCGCSGKPSRKRLYVSGHNDVNGWMFRDEGRTKTKGYEAVRPLGGRYGNAVRTR